MCYATTDRYSEHRNNKPRLEVEGLELVATCCFDDNRDAWALKIGGFCKPKYFKDLGKAQEWTNSYLEDRYS